MLLLQPRVRFLEQLQLRDLSHGTGAGRLRQLSSQSPVAIILPPLRQHEGMDLQRGGHRLDLSIRMLTQPDCRALKLGAVLPDRTRSGFGHRDTLLER